MSGSSFSENDPNFDVLRRFLNELQDAADPAKVVDDQCARYPDLAEQIRGLAEVDAALQEKTPDWPGPRFSVDGAPAAVATRIERLGPYRIVRVIARGGMGEVYEAVEEPLDRRVAVKTIRSGHATRPDWMERFLHEREVLARLHHTHIVPIFAAGQEGDLLYFSMPYIPGVSLGQVIHTARRTESRTPGHMSSTFEDLVARARSDSERTGPTQTTTEAPPATTASASVLELRSDYIRPTVQLMAAVAEALHHAHEAGIIHRDLKPSNLMVEPNGHPWVLDFGLARVRPGPDGPGTCQASALPNRVSVTVGPVGTIPYMAPEQHEPGRNIDARTDVWGLGVTLYELLTLHQAFKGRDSVLESDPVPPRALVKNLSRDLEAIILKALKKDPAKRYPTGLALSQDLRHWLNNEPVIARKARTMRRTLLWAKRNKGWSAAIVLCVVSILGSGVAASAHYRAEAAAAQARERIRHREVLVQEIQRIRMSSHVNGWRKSIEAKIVEAMNLAPDDGSLRPQAIGALRELDAYEEKGLPYPASSLAFDPPGRRLSSCWEMDQVIRVWDRETDEKRIFKLKGSGPFGFRPDGTPVQLAKVGKDERTLVLQDLAHEAVLRRFTSPQKDRPYFDAITMTLDGSHIAAIWRTTQPKIEQEPTETDPPALVAIWDATTGKLVRTIPHPATAAALALSPDARLLAVGDTRGKVAVWNLPGGTPYATLSASDNRIQCLTFGRDPRVSYHQKADIPPWQLAVGDGGGIVTMLDLGCKRIRNIGRGSGCDIKALDFSPDGSILASAGRGRVKLWNVATGRVVLDIGAGNFLPAVIFSPDGRKLAVGRWGIFGDTDGVKMLKLREGQGMRSLTGLATSISRVVFSPDGRLLAALADDWQVGIWETASGKLCYLLNVPPGYFSDNAWMAFDAESRRFAF